MVKGEEEMMTVVMKVFKTLSTANCAKGMLVDLEGEEVDCTTNVVEIGVVVVDEEVDVVVEEVDVVDVDSYKFCSILSCWIDSCVTVSFAAFFDLSFNWVMEDVEYSLYCYYK